jgi:hypothetical protein
MPGNRELANLKKPALLTAPVKAVFANSADFADQKCVSMLVRTRLGFSDTYEIFLPFHSLCGAYPRPRPALAKEDLWGFVGENGNSGMGQRRSLPDLKDIYTRVPIFAKRWRAKPTVFWEDSLAVRAPHASLFLPDTPRLKSPRKYCGTALICNHCPKVPCFRRKKPCFGLITGRTVRR